MTYTSEARPSKRYLSVAIGLVTICAALVAAAPALGEGSGGVGMGGSEDTPTAGGGSQEAGGGPENAGGGPESTSPMAGTTTPGAEAKLKGGFAIPPANAPRKVVRAIEAANEIVKGKPYCLGGGHGRWVSRCYDCSGTISYALGKKGARVLDSPMPSGSFTDWEKRGRGDWISVYANSGHMYAVIAGLRLDTSMTAGEGPGWSTKMRSGRGYAKRHPRGL